MSFIKKYAGKIECVAILLLFLLLNLNFTSDKSFGDKVLAAEHETAVVTADGYVVMGDNSAYKLPESDADLQAEETMTGDSAIVDSAIEDGQEEATAPALTDTAEDAGDETTTTEESTVDTSNLSDEYLALYQAASNYTIPEGIAFANVEDSLSIRKKADGESTQIGIMYPNNYCIIKSIDGEWAKVTTGSVTGYCRVKYLIQGEEAITLAKTLVSCTAKSTANVNIRSSACTTEDNIVASVEPGKVFPVTKACVLTEEADAPIFVEVTYNDKTAYVAIGKVKVMYSWTAGKSYEEKTSSKSAETVTKTSGTTYDSGLSAAETSDLRTLVVNTAKKYVGLDYVYGGNSLTTGCDCSGFVKAIFKVCNVSIAAELPRSSNSMSRSTLGKKIKYSEAKPGDLMFYGSGGKSTVDHVAIYIGGGLIIHESCVDDCVVIEAWNYRNPLVIRNFLG